MRRSFILYGCDRPGCDFNAPTLYALHAHILSAHTHTQEH